jgi:hypothetical protein
MDSALVALISVAIVSTFAASLHAIPNHFLRFVANKLRLVTVSRWMRILCG